MKYCPKCLYNYPDSEQFCSKCGSRLLENPAVQPKSNTKPASGSATASAPKAAPSSRASSSDPSSSDTYWEMFLVFSLIIGLGIYLFNGGFDKIKGFFGGPDKAQQTVISDSDFEVSDTNDDYTIDYTDDSIDEYWAEMARLEDESITYDEVNDGYIVDLWPLRNLSGLYVTMGGHCERVYLNSSYYTAYYFEFPIYCYGLSLGNEFSVTQGNGYDAEFYSIFYDEDAGEWFHGNRYRVLEGGAADFVSFQPYQKRFISAMAVCCTDPGSSGSCSYTVNFKPNIGYVMFKTRQEAERFVEGMF